jgi:methionyl-tRNA formyltransferase
MNAGFLSGKHCLLFGQINCKNSNYCLNILEQLGCIVTPIFSENRKSLFPSEKISKWKGDFIFSYRNYWLIPKKILDAAKIMAINFHPGTPRYPGSGSYSWALYDNSDEFGITVHLMNEKFDNGKIISFYKFKINSQTTLSQLIEKTYSFSLECFENFITGLNKKSLTKIKEIIYSPFGINEWNQKKNTIRDLEKMRIIDTKIPINEVKRRIRAFHHDKFPLILNFAGHEFELKLKKSC